MNGGTEEVGNLEISDLQGRHEGSFPGFPLVFQTSQLKVAIQIKTITKKKKKYAVFLK